MKLLNTLYLVCTVIVLVTCTYSKTMAVKIQKVPEKLITIGLLITDNKLLEARYAAEMAIDEANSNNESEGYFFQLIIRSMEGPWGTGSKEAVDLVFNEKVWALLGSHDGRNAHLVEQVIAKTQIPFVSAWAGDPTLSQAFVPWYFSCVPNNNQQASILINEIYYHQKLAKVITLSDKEYDSNVALKSFLGELKIQNLARPIQLSYDNANFDCDLLVNQIKNADCDGLVLFGQPVSSLKIIEMMRQNKMKQTVFGALSIIGENPFNHFYLEDYEGVVFINSGNWLSKKGITFSKNFENKYGWTPGAVAAYAYDGANLIIEAIKKSNFDRKKIKQSMLGIEYNGVTGAVTFDENGNRIGSNGLVVIKKGTPETIKN
ncbi:MAG: ABC transporter substrate-binding protein [Bacteroidetes bacterium]|nr:ABC transporter substrate-binding protein [Bacteroidota bacterium]